MSIKSKLSENVNSNYLMKHTYQISKYERNSGSKEELKSFEYIKEKLDLFGLDTSLTFNDAYISLPLHSQIYINNKEMPCITTSMSGKTGEEGIISKMLVIEDERDFDNYGPEIRGKILVLRGFSTSDKVQKAINFGASGCIFINGEHLHNMSVSKLWGNPTLETINKIPKICVVNVDQTYGEEIIQAAKHNQKIKIITRIDEGWRKIPTLIAELKGEVEPEKYILLSGHVDSWHYGAMDNASANATMMEVARIMASHPLRRSLKIAFWSGHSHGRYAGSTNYFDENFLDIYNNCLMHINIDSVGAIGATIVTEGNIMALTKNLATKVVKEETGQDFTGKPFGRNGDQSFWGAGVPSAFMSFSGQPMPTKIEKIDTKHMINQFNNGPKSSGFGWWWHTIEDTFDKIDKKILERDAKVYVSFVHHCCNDAIIPLDIVEGARQLKDLINGYQEVSKGHVSMKGIERNLDIFMNVIDDIQNVISTHVLTYSRELNEVIHSLSKVIVRLTQVGISRFDPDPTTAMPALPLLAELSSLSKYKEKKHEYLMLKTKLRRRINQVAFILGEGVREAQFILDKLE